MNGSLDLALDLHTSIHVWVFLGQQLREFVYRLQQMAMNILIGQIITPIGWKSMKNASHIRVNFLKVYQFVLIWPIHLESKVGGSLYQRLLLLVNQRRNNSLSADKFYGVGDVLASIAGSYGTDLVRLRERSAGMQELVRLRRLSCGLKDWLMPIWIMGQSFCVCLSLNLFDGCNF